MSSAATTEALKPCPFCGDPNPRRYWVNGLSRKHQMAYIECDLGECDSRSGEFDTMEEAVAAWNRRALTPSTWQPISTAPIKPFDQKNWFMAHSDYLLLWVGHTVIGSYGYTSKGKGRWRVNGRTPAIDPTHWQPLPAPPAAPATKEQP